MTDIGESVGNIAGTMIVAGVAVAGLNMVERQLNKRPRRRLSNRRRSKNYPGMGLSSIQEYKYGHW